MKQDKNNEIDLLLRRMSRRDGNAAAAAELGEKHLDADELSAYAQNALPAAARARYIEHLAECSSCRKLATELSLSLGTTTATSVETVPAPSGLKAFLASLFSPMVLRYAVPALGVIVVMVVGFVVLRQRQHANGDFVARVDTRPVSSSNSQPEAPAAASPPSAGITYALPEEKSASTAKTPETTPETQKSAAKPAEPKSADGSIATNSVGGATQGATTVHSLAELQPGVAAAAPAPAPAKAASPEAETDKKADEAQKKPAAATASVEVKNEPSPAPGSTNYQRADENANDSTAQRPAKTRTSEVNSLMGVRNRAAARRAEETKDEDKAKREEGAKSTAAKDEAKESARDDGETRSIAGRQFRKQRGIWVDTAYDSSTATVNMARGSEQFRALVGDEPVIGTIAKQLDGEVIVVWKGRAYRIR